MSGAGESLAWWLPVRYALPVLLALIVILAFPVTRGMRDAAARRKYWQLQLVTLLGAVGGAKLVVLMGDHLWPVVPLHDWTVILTSGRSIVGGLIFGFLAAEAAKPLLEYLMPPNDRFATVLPFSFAIGRIGCFLQGCCRGIAHDGLLSVTYGDGIARHPVQLFEAAFNVAIGIVFIVLLRRGALRHRLFATYLIAYGGYRFATEFIRATPHPLGGYSVYQVFAIVMVLLGVVSFVLRTPARNCMEEAHA
ncbi:MAG TPA: prolipoprotein diacylglyceryl transferase family protein [Thermoanaerobaculia bacterium]